ncbi:MAG: winged helix-turn-helix domain-containing protein, partial [Anaerolineales bacterium]|nr:winged helix-turn-helix domain-containing protein [Anaerolineales bacterium]
MLLEIRLLGRFDVRQNGAAVPVTARKGQALLAYLALHAGTAVRRELLAGLLWPDAPEETARANLRQTLWRLRRQLGAAALHADDVSLALAAAWVDTAVLQQAAGADALDVYHGDLLPGFYDDWVLPARARLRALWEQKMAAWLAALVAAARWREVRTWAARWLAHDPAAEAAYRALMQAHAGLGEAAQVTAVYERCVRALDAELGAPPAPQTTALLARLQAAAQAAPH